MSNSTPHITGATTIRSIRDLPIAGKAVFLRVDFNVPLSAPEQDPEQHLGESGRGERRALGERRVLEDARISESLPTLQYAIAQGARVVLASHLGRPEGKTSPEFSLEPVAHRLATLLGQEVTLADDCVGEGIELMVQSLKNGQVLLLENLRFHTGEEANDSEFAHGLSRLAQIYVNDAFGTAHRKHASTYGIASLVPVRGMGFLIEKELKYLDPLLHQPAKPFWALLGGSKVTDKLKTIESLMKRVNGLCIGGAMAHAFWAAQGDEIPAGAKQPKPEDVEAARSLMREASRRELPLLVPSDTNKGFDIGPKTIEKFGRALSGAKTVFWNGPLGWFEKSDYARGTFELARIIAGLEAIKIVGGGDTVSAVKQSGHADQFDHLSTGGGAVLEYLEGQGLPGIDILRTSTRGTTSSLQFEDLKPPTVITVPGKK